MWWTGAGPCAGRKRPVPDLNGGVEAVGWHRTSRWGGGGRTGAELTPGWTDASARAGAGTSVVEQALREEDTDERKEERVGKK